MESNLKMKPFYTVVRPSSRGFEGSSLPVQNTRNTFRYKSSPLVMPTRFTRQKKLFHESKTKQGRDLTISHVTFQSSTLHECPSESVIAENRKDYSLITRKAPGGIRLTPLESDKSTGARRKRLHKKKPRPVSKTILPRMVESSTDEENFGQSFAEDEGFGSGESNRSEGSYLVRKEFHDGQTKYSKCLTTVSVVPSSSIANQKIPHSTRNVTSDDLIKENGVAYTKPVITSLVLEAKSLSMITLMKALKEIVAEDSKFLAQTPISCAYGK